jgi:hypothetical protein
MASGYWSLGDGVVLREVRRGCVWSATPVTVVRGGGHARGQVRA